MRDTFPFSCLSRALGVRAVVCMSCEGTRAQRVQGWHGCVRIKSADGVAGCARDWRIDVLFATLSRVLSLLCQMCMPCVLLIDVRA